MKKHILLSLFSFLTIFFLQGQGLIFERALDIPLQDTGGNALFNPWTGGFNACLFGEIDLNGDGLRDLVVLDHHGDRLLPFLRTAASTEYAYRYAPQYVDFFPKLQSWFLLRDFDGDGREDLFTFDGSSGIRVFRNLPTADGFRFELYTPKIKAKLFATYEDLYCPSIDYPAIVDVDGDGDLDILTFWVPTASNRVFYYRNHSMEKYGHADSLDFIIEDRHWGCFEESDESNRILLQSCDASSQEIKRPQAKHTGSSLFVADLDHNGRPDLLLGDFGYPFIFALYNHGTSEKAKITQVDTLFPSGGTPVHLLSCPALSTLDLDLDGRDELLFSPFNSTYYACSASSSIWTYKNWAEPGQAPNYQRTDDRFLQNQSLDLGLGAYPTLVDLNHDGLFDIVVGNYGTEDSSWNEWGSWVARYRSSLHLLLNTGSATAPSFRSYPLTLSPSPPALALTPTFGDLDGDGEPELLLGSEAGDLYLYKRQDPSVFPPIYQAYDNIDLPAKVGLFTAPQLFDLNDDGLLDLIVGEQRTIWKDAQNRSYYKANLNYFANQGDAERPDFEWVTDSLGRVDVCNHEESTSGHSQPAFYKSPTGETLLFCGMEEGKVAHYNDIHKDALDAAFRRQPDLVFLENQKEKILDQGLFSAVAVGDLNGDGLPDLVVGNHGGGLQIFYGSLRNPSANQSLKPAGVLHLWPNPGKEVIHIQHPTAVGVIEIVDLQGKSLYSAPFTPPQQTIATNHLPKGIYVVRLTSAHKVFSSKWVKE